MDITDTDDLSINGFADAARSYHDFIAGVEGLRPIDLMSGLLARLITLRRWAERLPEVHLEDEAERSVAYATRRATLALTKLDDDLEETTDPVWHGIRSLLIHGLEGEIGEERLERLSDIAATLDAALAPGLERWEEGSHREIAWRWRFGRDNDWGKELDEAITLLSGTA